VQDVFGVGFRQLRFEVNETISLAAPSKAMA
jgi:hypothetical protein